MTDLTERLDEALDVQLRVNLGWVERRNVTAAEPEPTPTEVLTSRITALAGEWANDNDVEILSVDFDGVSAVIQAAGPVAPDAGPLVSEVRAIHPDGADVSV